MKHNKPIHYYNLIEEIKNNNVFLLVGSGLSLSLGYPSWADLINKLLDKIDNISVENEKWIREQFKNAPDWTAEIIKYKLGKKYNKAIGDAIDVNDKIGSISHALIALIPFKGYITTNYDTTIENYIDIFLSTKPKIITHKEIIDNQANINFNQLSVFKIHGCIKETKHDLVLTTSDYYKVLHDQRYIRLIDYLFAKNVILSIGFSLKDKDFRHFVEERYNLYGANCEPMYVFIDSTETCQIEIDLYQDIYNIHIIPISNDQSTEELLDLYCLVQQVDSKKFRKDINNLIICRLKEEGYSVNCATHNCDDIERACKLLSVFKDPINLTSFSSICTDNNISLSPAHYKIMSKYSKGKISISRPVTPDDLDISTVSKWIEKYFDSIPWDRSLKYLHIHDKKKFNEFFNTLSFLLSTPIGWNTLIEKNDNNNKDIFLKYSAFYRQGGKWEEWLQIIESVEKFIQPDNSLFLQLQKQKVWIYFWQRKHIEAKKINDTYPQINNIGHYTGEIALQYMKNDKDSLTNLINTLTSSVSPELDFFNISLLGRLYARLAIKTTELDIKDGYLREAKKCIKKSLESAKNGGYLAEISIQSWYLAMIHAELNEMDEMNSYLGEVRRLDECILNRVSGIAWLKVADFRLAIIANKKSHEIDKLKKNAKRAICSLGMQDVDIYLENDYFY